MKDIVVSRLKDSIKIKEILMQDEKIINSVFDVAKNIATTISEGGKVVLCGNGGSASDALHFAGEIVGRFKKERKSWPAIVLNADVATLTAIANDYGYDNVYERQVEGFLSDKDIFIGISTSGNSENVYRACIKANEIGATTVGFLGKDGGKIGTAVDVPIVIPCNVTSHIQECHITIIHIICEIVEEILG